MRCNIHANTMTAPPHHNGRTCTMALHSRSGFPAHSSRTDPVTGEGLLEIWLPVKERAGAQR